MAYANTADVAKILPPEDDELPDDDRVIANLETVLEEATDLIVGYLGRQYEDDDEDLDGVPDDVPGAVRRVTARIALRAFTDEPEDAGALASTNLMGPFSHTVNWSKEAQDRSVYLSDGERLRLDPYRQGGYSGGVAHYAMYDPASCGYYTRAGGGRVGY